MLGCLLVAGLALGSVDASAYRKPLIHEEAALPDLWLTELSKAPGEEIDGACGLAVSPDGTLYVSDYYHRTIHSFGLSGVYFNTFTLAGEQSQGKINELDAVCGLAADAAGDLYANEFGQGVFRFLPSEAPIDSASSTGVAVDEDGNLYVDNRSYVSVYDAPVEAGEEPSKKFGLGSLVLGFGMAVDSKAGRIYVADASDNTVKGFDLTAGPTSPPAVTITGPPGKASFNSLFNGAVAVDNSPTGGQGHVLVVDDLEPLHARPLAAVCEFDSNGTFLARLGPRTISSQGEDNGPIFGEPSGIAVDPKSGDVFVTTGNGEESNVVAYGPYEEGAPSEAESCSSRGQGLASRSSAGGAAVDRSNASQRPTASTVKIGHGVRVKFDGQLAPRTLPRHGTAPVGIVVDASISATTSDDPPQLRKIAIAINRNGHFTSQGLPACRVDQIQPSTTEGALAACRSSLVGEGTFSANVKLPEQSPFPSAGKVLAFNGKVDGRPAILAHIYGTSPAPTSIVLPFILRKSHGTYGTTLETSLPQATGNWGYVTGLRLKLRRSFSYRGHSRSFLSAGCPAPPGFPSAVFPLARTSFGFAGDFTINEVLTRTCKARG